VTTYFTRDGLAFLTELKKHNDKVWFEKNKQRYEAGLRDPGLKLAADLAPVLKKISKSFVVDLRPNGGSLSRIYRDTRFAKDKSPYKTALFFHFRHEDGDEEGAPGFYMHIGPGESRVGAGIWRPAPAKLAKIRDAIAGDAAAWRKAKSKTGLGSACMMSGESLKKVPKGYDPEHEHAEDLKRRDFGVSLDLSDSALTSAELVRDVGERFRAAAPVVDFLCDAIGLAF
jgi:uncharacterized protein (TIGR02453 family)